MDEKRLQSVVIAGLGNLDSTAERDVWRATWQVAVLLEIIDALSIGGEEGLKGDEQGKEDENRRRAALKGKLSMWAQDPAFTPTDVVVLGDLGIEVVPIPQAVERIDSRSLVFVPFVDGVVLLPEILGNRDIGVYIGSDIEEVVDMMAGKGYAERYVFLFYFLMNMERTKIAN
jgi:hypothetical protein